jgi:hypothetical protein
VCLALASWPTIAAAQNEAALRSFFEGKRVTLKIDMPGTSDGVDVKIGPGRTLDSSRLSDRLKRYGVAIPAGATTTVTLVKVKKDLIEFQLGGGGYGTFGDDTSSSVDMPLVEKSNREKDLESLVKRETDATKKRTLQRELDDLRNARERENRRITVEKQSLDKQKAAEVADHRLRGGSRFNIHYTNNVPTAVTPNDVVELLSEWIDFSGKPLTPTSVQSKTPVGGVLPKKGMLRADAERQFGKPIESTERREGTLRVVTLVFVRGEQHITAEFVEDVLIKYTVMSK